MAPGGKTPGKGNYIMKEYDNALECLSAECPSVLSGLSDMDRDILDGALDYESIVLRVSDNRVSTVDSINETVYSVETMQEFIGSTLQWLSEERQYFS